MAWRAVASRGRRTRVGKARSWCGLGGWSICRCAVLFIMVLAVAFIAWPRVQGVTPLHGNAQPLSSQLRSRLHTRLSVARAQSASNNLKFRRHKPAWGAPRCDHTVQGKHLIADSTGAVCTRKEIESDGCCRLSISPRNSCNSCQSELQCCTDYEFCISCCMGGGKEPVNRPRGPHHKPASDTNMFKKCAESCRTSSRMILHGNQYRHPYKHCYWPSLTDKEPRLPSRLTHPTRIHGNAGLSCRQVCRGSGLVCHEDFVSAANTCNEVSKAADCANGCRASRHPSAPALLEGGQCVVQSRPKRISCDAAAPEASRVCICVTANAVYKK